MVFNLEMDTFPLLQGLSSGIWVILTRSWVEFGSCCYGDAHIPLALLAPRIAQFSSFQPLSRVRLFATPWIAARQASLSITNSRTSLKLTSIESVMPSSHLILCRPLLLPPIPPIIRVFSNESTLRMRWPKYWSFSFSIIPSKEGKHNRLCLYVFSWSFMIISFVEIIYLYSLTSISPGVITATMFFMLDLPFLPQVHHKIQM